MRPLRILQIVPSVSLVYGGPSQMVLSFAKGLAAQGAIVTLLTTDANGDVDQPPLDVPLNKPVAQDGYEIRYFRCCPFRRYKFSLGLLNWLIGHTQEFDLAHIHALFSPISSAAAAIARQQNLPYVLRPLGTLDPADLQKKRQLKRLYAALIERSNLAGAAAVHFTSDQEAKVSERFGVVTRDLVLALGAEVTAAEPARSVAIRDQLNIPGDCPILLFMSRIDPKKGLNLLLPALEQLRAEGNLFHWVLAGTNPQDPVYYEAEIHRQIKASTLSDCTTITGFVSGAAKAALLDAADLFMLPSYYENFGIAIAEAMAAGTPVVISDQVHIWQEIERSQAGWISPCTVPDLTHHLRVALQDPAECRRRGVRAQAHALRHYSWNAIAQRMIQEYQEILAH